jgi:hypothetical protein
MAENPQRRHRRFEHDPPAALAASMIELFLADAELEHRAGHLAALQARLLAEAPAAVEPRRLRSEVHTAIGCLLDHLSPAREVVSRFANGGPATAWTGESLAVARELASLDLADHLSYQWFLADLEEEALAALRHLLDCPVCRRLTRILLFGFREAE